MLKNLNDIEFIVVVWDICLVQCCRVHFVAVHENMETGCFVKMLINWSSSLDYYTFYILFGFLRILCFSSRRFLNPHFFFLLIIWIYFLLFVPLQAWPSTFRFIDWFVFRFFVWFNAWSFALGNWSNLGSLGFGWRMRLFGRDGHPLESPLFILFWGRLWWRTFGWLNGMISFNLLPGWLSCVHWFLLTFLDSVNFSRP